MQRAPTWNEIYETIALAEKEGQRPIEKAVEQGDLEAVKKYVNNGGLNNPFGVFKNTLLHCAACSGHKHIVEYLLSCPGINTALVDGGGSTALHDAALNSHPEIVKLLCEFDHYKEINSTTRYGSTALHLAIDTAKTQDEILRSNAVLDYLLKVPEIDIFVRTYTNQTPLTLAEKYERPDLKEKLVKAATIQSKVTLSDINVNGKYIELSFTNQQERSLFFHMEVVLPNLKEAFDNNPNCLYKIFNTEGYTCITTSLARKDGKQMIINNEILLHEIKTHLAVQLAKNTDIKIKIYSHQYLGYDTVYPHKAYREACAFQAFLIPVLISIVRQDNRIVPELWIKVFSFCNEVVNDYQMTLNAFNAGLKLLVQHNQGEFLVNHYSSAGGSTKRLAQLSLFSPTTAEKIEKLREWAKENPEGASKKTVTHYFLGS